MGGHFVSSLICTLKSKKTFKKPLKNLKTFSSKKRFFPALCGSETALCCCKIKYVSKFIAASRGSHGDSTALVTISTVARAALKVVLCDT